MATIGGMGRYIFTAFNTATTPRYVRRLESTLDSDRVPAPRACRGSTDALAAAFDRLAGEGWQPEGETEYLQKFATTLSGSSIPPQFDHRDNAVLRQIGSPQLNVSY